MKNKLIILTLFLCIAGLSPALSQEAAVALPAFSTDAPKRYAGMVEFGYLFGNLGNSGASLSVATPTVQLFNGYRFHRLLAVGGTVSLDFYDGVLVTPVALGVRGELSGRRLSPVYGVDAGYGTTFLNNEDSEQESEGGWMFSPSAGIWVNTGNNTAFTFTAGYRSQKATVKTNWWGGGSVRKITYERFLLRMGFMF